MTRLEQDGPSPPEGSPPSKDDWRRAYWRRNLRLMVVLLIIWFAVSFGCGILFVEQLNQIVIAGFPLGFWFAQQGSIYVFILLILVYGLMMDRLDKEYGVHENGQPEARPAGEAAGSESESESSEGGRDD